MSETPVKKLSLPRGESVRTRLMHMLGAFVGRIPPALGNPIADRVGDIVYYVARKSRRAAISNMYHVLGPQATKAELKHNVHWIFRNSMRNYYDLSRSPFTSNDRIDSAVDFDWEGWGRVVDFQKKKIGVILVTAHFGSFDMMTQVITRRDLPLTVLIARIEPAWLSDFITDLRGERGLNLVEVEEEIVGSKLNLGALKKTVSILRSGGMLGVVADRNSEPNGVHIRFFGQDTIVAAGVAKMALRAKAVVIPSICLRLPGNRYSLDFGEPIVSAQTGSTDEDVKIMLTQIFARFEQNIRCHPDQWVILQPVWRPR
jgi:lauroyl/myristoyl acyltransferase